MTGYEWLSKSVTVADSGRLLLRHSGDAARTVARLLFHESRRPGAEGFLRRSSAVSERPRNPIMLFFVFTGFRGFYSRGCLGEMTSIGTLFAFILVCIGVWIMRVRRPDMERGFRVPALPVVAILGVIVCGAMIYGLGWTNWMRLDRLAPDRIRLLLFLWQEP